MKQSPNTEVFTFTQSAGYVPVIWRPQITQVIPLTHGGGAVPMYKFSGIRSMCNEVCDAPVCQVFGEITFRLRRNRGENISKRLFRPGGTFR